MESPRLLASLGPAFANQATARGVMPWANTMKYHAHPLHASYTEPVNAKQAIKRVKSHRLSTASAVNALQGRGFQVTRAPEASLEKPPGLERSLIGASDGAPADQSQHAQQGMPSEAQREGSKALESTIYSRERGTLPEFVPLSKSKQRARRAGKTKSLVVPRSQSVDFLRESIRRDDDQGVGDPNHERWQVCQRSPSLLLIRWRTSRSKPPRAALSGLAAEFAQPSSRPSRHHTALSLYPCIRSLSPPTFLCVSLFWTPNPTSPPISLLHDPAAAGIKLHLFCPRA